MPRPLMPLVLISLAFMACKTDPSGSKGEVDDTAGGSDGDPEEVWALELDPACSPFAMGNDCLTP